MFNDDHHRDGDANDDDDDGNGRQLLPVLQPAGP